MAKKGRLTVCSLLFFFISTLAHSQDFALKTNVLYWAAATPNLGMEVALSPKFTLDLSGAYNPWTYKDDKKMRFWLAQPEVRYWFCEKFEGHFIGIHAHGAQYFGGFCEKRYDGYLAGGGVSSAGAVTDAPVMLERIVSRTDIRRINSGENGTDPVDYSTDDKRKDFLSPLINGLYESVQPDLQEQIKVIMSAISNGFFAFASDPSYGLTGTEYRRYSLDLGSDKAVTAVLANVKESVVGYLETECLDNETLENRLQSWNEQSVVLEVSNLAAKYLIGFADGTDSSVGAKSESEDPVSRTYGADASGVISIAGFGDGTSLNELNSISLVGSDGGKLSFDGLSGFYLWHGENKMNEGICNPVSTLKFSDTSKAEIVTLSCNLMDLFGNEDFSSSWDDRFKAVLNEVISENKYGGSFSSAVLTVSIPACEDNLTATASIQ